MGEYKIWTKRSIVISLVVTSIVGVALILTCYTWYIVLHSISQSIDDRQRQEQLCANAINRLRERVNSMNKEIKILESYIDYDNSSTCILPPLKTDKERENITGNFKRE